MYSTSTAMPALANVLSELMAVLRAAAKEDVESNKKCSYPSKLAFTSFIFFWSDSFSLSKDNEPVDEPLPLSIVAIPFL